MLEIMNTISKRTGLFMAFSLCFLAVFYDPLKGLFLIATSSELYSHLIFIPILSVYFIYADRNTIFAATSFSLPGIILIFISLSLLIAGINWKGMLGQNDYLSLTILAAVIWWIGVFILIYGFRAYRSASFPLFFLFFAIPPPQIILNNGILLLQAASAGITHLIFKIIGIPVYRQGFKFNLPGVNLEIAEQCGGIRSTTVLIVLSVLFGYVFLKTWWEKTILMLSVFPITVIKNGLRIVSLYLLAVHIDKSILDSIAHRRGGYPFFLLALAEMGMVIWVLKKFEKKRLHSQ